MSEKTEVPIVCDDCGGNLTNAGGTIDDLFSMALGEDRPHYWHIEQSGCIASLNERLTLATQRAEAAEAERDALRKDAARLDYLDTVRDPYSRRPMREVIGTEWSIVFTHPATHTPTIRAALDAASRSRSAIGAPEPTS